MTSEAPGFTWLTLGDERVRADQIAHWRDDYYNGWQHYVTVTLATSGQKIKAEVTRDQWDVFVTVMRP